MYQTKKMTHEEKIVMYNRLEKEELIELLIESNITIDNIINSKFKDTTQIINSEEAFDERIDKVLAKLKKPIKFKLFI